MHDESTGQTLLSNTQKKKLAAQTHNEAVRNAPPEEKVVPTLEEAAELEALSKEVFNAKSRYLTLIAKGETVPVTETVTEYVPAADGGEGTTKEVQVPVYAHNADKGKKSVVFKTVKYNVKTVKTYMLKIKEEQDRVRAILIKMEEEKRAERQKAQLAKEVQDKLSGSAI